MRGKCQPSMVEEQLERFVAAAWLRLDYRVRHGRRELYVVSIQDYAALEEFVDPGRQYHHRRALAEAREQVAPLIHPVARTIAKLLAEPPAEKMPLMLLRALAAIAGHVESGEVLAERVFANRYLGYSKALLGIRQRLERLLGPLESLGIREGGAVTLLGGAGRIVVMAQGVDLAALPPFIGLSRATLTEEALIEFPKGGVLVVENFTVFEACCRGEVPSVQDALIVWSAGYPGRAVRAVVEQAARRRAVVRVWADLDFDGVRIARLIASWAAGSFTSYRMSPVDVLHAPIWRPLGGRARRLIEADVAESPDGLLADTLRALLEVHRWVEQECFLGTSTPAQRSSS